MCTEMKFALLIALALACGQAGALKCFFCNSILSANSDCDNGPGAEYIVECPAPPGGVTRCTKLDGTINTSLLKLNGIERGCSHFPSDTAPENKCYIDDEVTALIIASAPPSLMPYLNGTFSIEGKFCVCNSDECNSGASIQPFLGLLVAAAGLYVIGVW